MSEKNGGCGGEREREREVCRGVKYSSKTQKIIDVVLYTKLGQGTLGAKYSLTWINLKA